LTWGVGVDDFAEVGAVGVAIDGFGAEELGMIEEVERLHAQREGAGFTEGEFLLQGCVEVFRARAIKEAPMSGSHLAQLRNGQQSRVEGGLAVARIAVQLEIARREVGRVDAVVVDAVGHGTDKRSVVVVEEGDGHSGTEARDAGKSPVSCGFLCPMILQVRKLSEGQRDAVTDDKVVADIEGGDGAADGGIDGVEFLGEAGGVIEGLGEGVRAE